MFVNPVYPQLYLEIMTIVRLFSGTGLKQKIEEKKNV
jgi:hypothetical protein